MEQELMEAFPVSRHAIDIDTVDLSSISQLRIRLTEDVQGFLSCFLLYYTAFFLALCCAMPHCTPLYAVPQCHCLQYHWARRLAPRRARRSAPRTEPQMVGHGAQRRGGRDAQHRGRSRKWRHSATSKSFLEGG